jgi:hypothetical protein
MPSLVDRYEHCYILKTEEVGLSETFLTVYQTGQQRRHIPGDSNPFNL